MLWPSHQRWDAMHTQGHNSKKNQTWYYPYNTSVLGHTWHKVKTPSSMNGMFNFKSFPKVKPLELALVLKLGMERGQNLPYHFVTMWALWEVGWAMCVSVGGQWTLYISVCVSLCEHTHAYIHACWYGCMQKLETGVSQYVFFFNRFFTLVFETRSLIEILCLLSWLERLTRKASGESTCLCPPAVGLQTCATLPGFTMQVLRIWTHVPMPVQWALHLLNHLPAPCGLLSWKATTFSLTRKSRGFSASWKCSFGFCLFCFGMQLDLVHEVLLFICIFRSTDQPLDF